MLSRWLPSGVFLLALLWTLSTLTSPGKPEFALPDGRLHALSHQAAAAQPSYFKWADLPRPTLSAHAVTVAEVQAEDVSQTKAMPVHLVAAWFGGTREGAADVSLYQSEWRMGSGWQPAREMISRTQAAQQLGRHIRKLGNPLLVSGPGTLQLFFVSVSYGGWAGSALNRSVSHDAGKTWTPAQRIITSPFFNLSTLVRNPGSWYADGSLGLPAYHEFIGKHGIWLRLDAQGHVLGLSRMPASRPDLQPAVVPLGAQRAVAALRDAGGGDGQVQWSQTQDAGQTWSEKSPRVIPNPNSAIAMIGLQDGTLLMACNPLSGSRNQLSLLRSTDQGQTWALVRVVEQSPDDHDEFSYPALLQDSAGAIHLLYTWKRQGIRHATFTQAWLNHPGNPTQAAVTP